MNSPFKKEVSINDINKYVTQLYLLPDKIQFCHHLTLSFAQHSALDRTYDSLSALKDSIVEKIIGYTGKRFTALSLGNISGFGPNMPKMLADEIMSFGKELEEWAEENEYCDVENLAQEYSGVGAQLAYLLTLN